MPLAVANAPAVLQELMNKILYILRRQPLVQELICEMQKWRTTSLT